MFAASLIAKYPRRRVLRFLCLDRFEASLQAELMSRIVACPLQVQIYRTDDIPEDCEYAEHAAEAAPVAHGREDITLFGSYGEMGEDHIHDLVKEPDAYSKKNSANDTRRVNYVAQPAKFFAVILAVGFERVYRFGQLSHLRLHRHHYFQ
jgi:hypothetical protein